MAYLEKESQESLVFERLYLGDLVGGSEKIVGLGVGAPKICILQNQHDIIIQIGWFSTQQFNDLCNSAILSRMNRYHENYV